MKRRSTAKDMPTGDQRALNQLVLSDLPFQTPYIYALEAADPPVGLRYVWCEATKCVALRLPHNAIFALISLLLWWMLLSITRVYDSSLVEASRLLFAY